MACFIVTERENVAKAINWVNRCGGQCVSVARRFFMQKPWNWRAWERGVILAKCPLVLYEIQFHFPCAPLRFFHEVEKFGSIRPFFGVGVFDT